MPPDPFGSGEEPFASGDLPPDPFGTADPVSSESAASSDNDPTSAGLFGLLGPLFANMRAAGGADRMRRDVARQSAVATSMGTSATPESNPDPVERIRLAEIAAIALPHVVDIGGWAPTDASESVNVKALTRAQFAVEFLDAFQDMFDGFARAFSVPGSLTGDRGLSDEDSEFGALAPLFELAGPTMLGAQAGGLAGQLASRLLGGHDLPLPGPGTTALELVAVPANFRSLIEEWSLPPDVVRIQFCLVGLAQLAVLRRPHIAHLLRAQTIAHATGHEPDPQGLLSRFEQLDMTNPAAMSKALSGTGPLGMRRTADGEAASRALMRVVIPLVGWVDYVVQQAGQRLLGGESARVEEAWRRRRIGSVTEGRTVAEITGVRLDRAVFDQGASFIKGVVERAGADGLFQLWTDESTLPTEAELRAPGLWLARLEG